MENKEEKLTIEVNKNTELEGIRADIDILSDQSEPNEIFYQKTRIEAKLFLYFKLKVFTFEEGAALGEAMLEAYRVANAKADRNKPKP